MNSPQEKKNVCVEAHHLRRICRNISVSLYMLQLRERSIASATPACSKRLQKSASKNSSATQCAQSAEAEQGNSKSIGTGCISPLWILRLEMLERGGTQTLSAVTSLSLNIHSHSGGGRETLLGTYGKLPLSTPVEKLYIFYLFYFS